jgi:hypothetical protein
MLSHVAEWVGAVLAVGVVAGLVVLAAAAAAGWLLYRRLRRRVATLTSSAARSALQAIGPVAGGRVRLPPRVVHDLRRRLNGPPEAW